MTGFTNYETVSEVTVEGLKVGDYSCEFEDGSRSNIIFERKSQGDAWGTLTKGYARFKREMLKAKEMGIILILTIEASLTKINDGFFYKKNGKKVESKIKGSSMLMKLYTLRQRYGLEFRLWNNREEMVRDIVETYNAEGRERYREKR